jgi:hypothetical protein
MARLRVLAGPSPDALTNITNVVNTSTPTPISSDIFEGSIVVNVKGLTNERGEVLDSEYFQRADRKGITWSIQLQGRGFLVVLAERELTDVVGWQAGSWRRTLLTTFFSETRSTGR